MLIQEIQLKSPLHRTENKIIKTLREVHSSTIQMLYSPLLHTLVVDLSTRTISSSKSKRYHCSALTFSLQKAPLHSSTRANFSKGAFFQPGLFNQSQLQKGREYNSCCIEFINWRSFIIGQTLSALLSLEFLRFPMILNFCELVIISLSEYLSTYDIPDTLGNKAIGIVSWCEWKNWTIVTDDCLSYESHDGQTEDITRRKNWLRR